MYFILVSCVYFAHQNCHMRELNLGPQNNDTPESLKPILSGQKLYYFAPKKDKDCYSHFKKCYDIRRKYHFTCNCS